VTSILENLALGRSAVNRAAEKRVDEAWWDSVAYLSDTRVIAVHGATVATRGDSLAYLEPNEIGSGPRVFLGISEEIVYVGTLDFAASQEPPQIAGVEWTPLRAIGESLNDLEAGLAVTALAANNWHQTHTHCPRCGEPTFITNAGWVRQCPGDGSEHYPRTDAAVIMVITDVDDRILIARQTVWQQGHFSVVAGFVEPGETFEAAVRREAFEEVGIEVAECTYLGSQPWPFPASLMVGFIAKATTTAITVDGVEIEEAQWVSRTELEELCQSGDIKLPARVSIARRLIEHWYGSHLPNEWSRT
jgi:NAD+ diphosphatase